MKVSDHSSRLLEIRRRLGDVAAEMEKSGRLSPIIPTNIEQLVEGAVTNINSGGGGDMTTTTLLSSSLSISQPNDQQQQQQHPFAKNSKEMFIYLILESIRQEEYRSAVEYFRLAQNYLPSQFRRAATRSDELDFDIILLFVCEHIRYKHPGKQMSEHKSAHNVHIVIFFFFFFSNLQDMLVIVEPDNDELSELGQTVLGENMEISKLVDTMDRRFRGTLTQGASMTMTIMGDVDQKQQQQHTSSRSSNNNSDNGDAEEADEYAHKYT